MFMAQQALFLYAVSPVHMGAGQAIGLIDNPIQREVHTQYPSFAGSGLKGAVRHRFWAQSPDQHERLNRYFGPDTGASDFAGAISFSDAQLVVFPVRCAKQGFVYATSPTALARAKRLLIQAQGKAWSKDPETPIGNQCRYINPDLLSKNNKLLVEAYELDAKPSEALKTVGEYLAQHALPAGDAYEYFRNKLKQHLVLMSDDDFGYFVRNATSVEAHVRIDNTTGVAADGGLFYTENLPPESILLSLIMASDERSKQADKAPAQQILHDVVQGKNNFGGLHGQVLQVGGDATTGRGQIVVSAVQGA